MILIEIALVVFVLFCYGVSLIIESNKNTKYNKFKESKEKIDDVMSQMCKKLSKHGIKYVTFNDGVVATISEETKSGQQKNESECFYVHIKPHKNGVKVDTYNYPVGIELVTNFSVNLTQHKTR